MFPFENTTFAVPVTSDESLNRTELSRLTPSPAVVGRKGKISRLASTSPLAWLRGDPTSHGIISILNRHAKFKLCDQCCFVPASKFRAKYDIAMFVFSATACRMDLAPWLACSSRNREIKSHRSFRARITKSSGIPRYVHTVFVWTSVTRQSAEGTGRPSLGDVAAGVVRARSRSRRRPPANQVPDVW